LIKDSIHVHIVLIISGESLIRRSLRNRNNFYAKFPVIKLYDPDIYEIVINSKFPETMSHTL